MEYKDRIKDETYIFPAIARDFPVGFVEVGGSPDAINGRWLVRVSAEKRKGLFGGYAIKEDIKYPGDYVEVDKSFTLSGAMRKVAQRVINLASIVSQQTGLPIVNIEETLRQKDKADQIAVERIRAQAQ